MRLFIWLCDCIRNRLAATSITSTATKPSTVPLVRLGQGEFTTYIEGKTND